MFINNDIVPSEIADLEPDFEDDRANDKTLEAELDDIFGTVVSERDLGYISDDEWEALKGE